MLEVSLWLLSPASLPDAGQGWVHLLDAQERSVYERFRFAEDRRAYVAAHGLLRQALTLRDPSTAAEAWRFATGPQGKPFLPDSPLRFNLSHCRELVAVAIATEVELGVDVETIDERHATGDVARCVYGPAELEELAAHPIRVERFYERWTLKEAWVKATGEGLSDDLPGFELRIEPGRASVARGDVRPWSFRWWTPRPDVKLAVCVGSSEALEITPRWWPT